MNEYNEPGHVNVGIGSDIAIADLADMVKDITGFGGQIAWDTTKPDGTPRKLMDVTKINRLGWHAKIDLASGIKSVYEEVLTKNIF
jgi:GDP-L-fucose synthase